MRRLAWVFVVVALGGCDGFVSKSDAGHDAGAKDAGLPDAGEPVDAGAVDCGVCPEASPACDTETLTCVECLTSADCPGARPSCDVATHTCFACLDNADCPGNAPVCDTERSRCVACLADKDCKTPETPFCDVRQGACVEAGESCAQPFDVPLATGGTATFVVDTAHAANDEYAFCSDTGPGNPERVYRVTLTEAQDLTVTATAQDTDGGPLVDPVVYVRRGACEGPSTLACSDTSGASEQVQLLNQPAGDYFIFIETFRQSSGLVDVTVKLSAPTAGVANDTCSAPEPLVLANGSATATVNTAAAADDYSGSCNASANSPDVVYELTLAQPEKVVVQASGGNGVKPVVFLLDGTCGAGAGAELGCAAASATSNVTLVQSLLPAGTYYLFVESKGTSAAGTIDVTVTTGQGVAGDTCTSAVPLSVGANSSASFQVDTSAASNDEAGSCNASTTAGEHQELVYALTLSQAQDVTITAAAASGSGIDPVLYVRGAPCSTGVEVDCSDAYGTTETLSLINLAAGTWYVFIETYGSTAGILDVTVATSPPTLPPANDTCASPTLVSFPNGTGTTSFTADTTLASNDYQGSCNGNTSTTGNQELVYQITLTQTATLTVDVQNATGSYADAVLYLREAPCASGTELDCVDNAYSYETLTASSLPAGDYFLFIETWNGDNGALDVTITAQ